MSDNLNRIRSYVIRAARMSDAQKKAYRDLSGKFVIPYGKKKIVWDEYFPGLENHIIEIGFGMGDATGELAAAQPGWGILGIEVHRPGVGKLLWTLEREELSNVRIIEHDAVEVLENMISEESVDGLHIWFPDPWPKKKHHKRRLIQPRFAELLSKSLKTGAYLHAATDWEPYAEQILAVFDQTRGLKNRYRKWAPKPDYRPDTKFENRGIVENRNIRDIIFEKEIT